MNVRIFPSAEAAEAATAALLIQQVQRNTNAVLGLATGGTMSPVYQLLVSAYQQGRVSFADITTFNLDEYSGLAPDHPRSYRSFMRAAFFDQTDIPLNNTHIPIGNTRDPDKEAERYEALIEASGGIDCQLLGIGQNGHIGFNEPGTPFHSRTRVEQLSNDTRAANQRYFPEGKVPEQAITIGIGTILDSREIILLAIGDKKANAVAVMIESPSDISCPASALQQHPNATILLDQAAAAQLQQLFDYEQVDKAN